MPAQGYTVTSLLEERLKGRRAALDALRALDDGGYQLFYTPSLRGQAVNADAPEPAVDYIIAHKEKGLLGIVIKSGDIVEEPGGYMSQYQPQRQLYKIIDPVTPAGKTLKALLSTFDADAERVYPCGIAVLLPDTERVVFSQPKDCYLFAEDIAAPDFVAKLGAHFREPAAADTFVRFRDTFAGLCEFLSRHSDNAAIFEQRKEKLQTIAEEVRKPTKPVGYGNLRMKVAVAAEQPADPPPVIVAELVVEAPVEIVEEKSAEETAIAIITPRKTARVKKVPPPLPLVDDEAAAKLALAKAEKLQKPIPIPAAPPRRASALRRKAAATVAAPAQQDIFGWLSEVGQKGEGDAALGFGGWLMVIGVSAAAICCAYFISRSLAGVL